VAALEATMSGLIFIRPRKPGEPPPNRGMQYAVLAVLLFLGAVVFAVILGGGRIPH
jgi:hypothetical protein